MTIRFTCSECASVLKIKDELAGTPARCPKCKTKFVVPNPSPDEEPSVEETEKPQDSEKAPPSNDHEAPTNASTSNESRRSDQDSAPTHPDPASVPLEPSVIDSSSVEPILERPSSAPTAEFSESPTVAATSTSQPVREEAPLSLDDSDSEVDAVPSMHHEEPSVTANDAHEDSDDDDDSPPVFVSTLIPTSPSMPEPQETTKTEKRRSSESSKSESAKANEEPFDPMKFLMADSPVKERDPFPPSARDDSDLSLSDESDDDLDRATPQPATRRSTNSANTRATPEKVDLATAAKMMKKAIKDSQAEAAHQREIEASGGYDYFLFFREFGVRGAAVLAGGIVMFFVCLYAGNAIFSSRLKLPPLGYVRGTVTLDGQPLRGAIVYYAPNDAKIEGSKRESVRTSMGVTDDKGAFKMMYVPGDNIEGVAVGDCRVWVTHMGEKGDDVPPEWAQGALVVKKVTAGHQKVPADIEMKKGPVK